VCRFLVGLDLLLLLSCGALPVRFRQPRPDLRHVDEGRLGLWVRTLSDYDDRHLDRAQERASARANAAGVNLLLTCRM
jgi:hypothetical protein